MQITLSLDELTPNIIRALLDDLPSPDPRRTVLRKLLRDLIGDSK